MKKRNFHCIGSLIWLILFVWPGSVILAQSKSAGVAVGRVLDKENGQPLSYVTVAGIDRNGKCVATAFTGESGSVRLPLKKEGEYTLVFSMMGYASDSVRLNVGGEAGNTAVALEYSFGDILLVTGQQLEGVVVSAQKSLLSREVDRLVYDVTQDPDAKRLNMAGILKKIPFMEENMLNGKLKYLNNDVATILINGQRNEMINGTRQFPLQLIKGNVMNSIEVILPDTPENPGKVPIVNIKLDRELPEGFAAEVEAGGSTDRKVKGGIDFISKVGKLYLSVFYNTSYSNPPALERESEKEIPEEEGRSMIYTERGVSYGNRFANEMGTGLSWQMSKKDNLSVRFSTHTLSFNNYSEDLSWRRFQNGEDELVRQSHSVTNGGNTPQLNAAATYEHKLKNNGMLGFNYALDMNKDSDHSTITMLENDIRDDFYSGNGKSSQEHVVGFFLKVNWNRRHYLNGNVSYVYRQYASSSFNGEMENGLDYTQQIERVLAKYSFMQKKIVFGAGIALENMSNRGWFYGTEESRLCYDRLNFFPNASISYKLKNMGLNLSYSTRALRPGISYLNPYVNDTDPMNIHQGNPSLRPEYSHTVRLRWMGNYKKILNWDLCPSVEFLHNAVERITTMDDRGVTYTTYENIGKKREYLCVLQVGIQACGWLSINNSVSYTYSVYTAGDIRNQVGGWRYSGFMNVRILKSAYLSGAFIYAAVMNPQSTEVKYVPDFSFSYSQTVVPNKFFVMAVLEDPFISHRFVTNVIGTGSGSMITSRQERYGRVLSVSLRWNFGRLKDKRGGTQQDNAGIVDQIRPDKTR